MSTIHKKVWQEYFELILAGKKKMELRLADFEINEGDTLVLEEWDKDANAYTGRSIEVTATYILKTKGQTFWSPEDVEKYGFQVIQFEPKAE
jgi:ASC-1-like (ASCH) protein